MKSSKLSTPKSFSMSVVWNIWWIFPLGVTLMLTALLQNQVEWISLGSCSWRHLKASCWFSQRTLADEKLTRIERVPKISAGELFLFFESLNFKITLSLFFSRWHACKSSEVTWFPVREIALQTVFSRALSPMSWGNRLTSRDSLWWYWVLLAVFCSNWIISWCRRILQFFVISRSDFNCSCFEVKVSNLSFKAFNWMLK